MTEYSHPRITSFAAACHLWRSNLAMYHLFGRHHCIHVDTSEPIPKFAFRNAHKLDPEIQGFLRYAASSSSTAIDALIWSEITTAGAKLFRPTEEQAATLSQVEIPLQIQQYQQPFTALTIEFPAAWRAGQRCHGTRIDPFTGKPQNVEIEPIASTIYRHPDGPVFVSTLVDQAYTLTRTLCDPDRPIEDGLDSIEQLDDPRLHVGDHEEKLSQRCTRLALNCGLLLAAFGSKSLGPANPDHAARLDRQIAKRNKHAEAARLDRALIAELVTLDREVSLFRTTTSRPVSDSSDTDRSVRPHWRRGHWRTQHHGPANSLTRPVFIAPVLVNRDLLPDDWRPGMTVYRA